MKFEEKVRSHTPSIHRLFANKCIKQLGWLIRVSYVWYIGFSLYSTLNVYAGRYYCANAL